MLKAFIVFLLIFLSFSNVNASNELKIYNRSEWGADEEYRYQDSKYWKKIIFKR
jgi:hypothetical protein